jgi:RNase adapter protein RapZ
MTEPERSPRRRTAAGQPSEADAGGETIASSQHVVIITGLSGAGKTAASKIFEDLGYTVVDNVPAELLRDLAELVANDPVRYDRVAIVLDVRQGDAPTALGAALGALHGRDLEPQIVFLEASDEVLVRRYSETRHRHPLDDQNDGVQSAIARERQLLDEVRDMAQTTIDTSGLSFKQLRERITEAIGAQPGPGQLSLQVITFGFKYGVPMESDLVFDVRFMENPFYRPELRDRSGLTPETREFVLGQPVTEQFLARVEDFLATLIPAYLAEGKTRLTIGIGCTGGFHRSVAIGEALGQQLQGLDLGPVSVWHRELDRAR